MVYPLVQMGPVDVTVDETVTGRVFRGAPSRAVLYLASGYFNLTDNYQRCVVDECAATFSILSAAPEVLSDSHAHTRLTALCLRLPGWACTREVKPIWILLKEETVSGSGISWAICKSAPRSRQITTPAAHRSVFYRPDALPAAQPTASKH